MARIFISMPCVNGQVHQKTLITGHTITFKHEPCFKYIENCSLVTKARQDHFGMFVQQKHDYLLTFDADMVVGPPGILDDMIERLPENAISGGLYAMKAHTLEGLSPTNGTPLDKEEKVILDGRLIKMRYLPTGFMLTPRRVALKLVELYKDLEYFDHQIGKTWAVYNTMLIKDETGVQRFLPEDFSYCERVRAAGIDIYGDTGVMLGHLGQYLYHIEHLRQQSEQLKEQK